MHMQWDAVNTATIGPYKFDRILLRGGGVHIKWGGVKFHACSLHSEVNITEF